MMQPLTKSDFQVKRPKQETKTYLESIVKPYLKNFNWTGDGDEILKDEAFLWQSVYKNNNPAKIKEIMEWAKSHDEKGKTVHVRGIARLLIKHLAKI